MQAKSSQRCFMCISDCCLATKYPTEKKKCITFSKITITIHMYEDFPIDSIRKIELQNFLLIPIDMPCESVEDILFCSNYRRCFCDVHVLRMNRVSRQRFFHIHLSFLSIRATRNLS